jgi:polyphosphate kinase 2
MVKSAAKSAPSRKSDGSAHSQFQKGSAKKSAKGKAQTPDRMASVQPLLTGDPLVITSKFYDAELARLQTELVKMQEWIVHEGLRLCVIFEGRDTAGKGGTIKRIMERLNARNARVVALGTPTEREKSQWYFQRYIPHLPAAGEIVLFDRSWYNRAGVEHVMGFCTPGEYDEFLRTCPQIERALVHSGIVLVKYWMSLSDEEQERRFLERIDNPGKRWKLSPMDLQARARWVDYAEAKDEMFAFTDIKEAPWHVVDANDKKCARLNLISHLLSMVPYQEVPYEAVELPSRQERAYKRPPIDSQTWISKSYVRG